MRKSTWLIAFAALCLPGVALAADSIDPTVLISLISSMRDYGYSNLAGRLVPDGKYLASILFGVSLFIQIMPMVFGVLKPHQSAGIILLSLSACLVSALLMGWPGSVPAASAPSSLASSGGGSKLLIDFSIKDASKEKLFAIQAKQLFVDSFDELQAKMMDGSGSGKDGAARDMRMTQGVGQIGKVWSKINDAYAEREKVRAAQDAELKSYQKVIRFLDTLGDLILTRILFIAISGFMFVLMILYVIMMYFGDLLMVLGMIVGPIMIPCLLFKPLQQVWNNWLAFMIQAGLYKVIGGAIITLTVGTLSTIQDVTNSIFVASRESNKIADIGVMTGALPLSWVMMFAYLFLAIFSMIKAYEISRALMGGGISAAMNGVGGGASFAKSFVR